MKAQVIEKFGEPSVFQLVDVPKPAPASGQVLVRVSATSVNPLDARLRRNGGPLVPKTPAILHLDFSGTVAEVGQDVRGFAVGDEVFGFAGGVGGIPGALAEYLVADAQLIARKPKSISMKEAAALPIVSVTAWEGLVNRAAVKKGSHILVHAGAGGVGHMAVQLAKHLGATVYATASTPEKLAIAASLGAKVAFDYRNRPVADYVAEFTKGHGFDAIYDTVGGATLDASIAAVAVNGQVISCQTRSTHDLTLLHGKGASLHAVFVLLPILHNVRRQGQGEILRQVSELVDRKVLRPLLDAQVFSLDQAPAAHARLESGKAVGKVVIGIQ